MNKNTWSSVSIAWGSSFAAVAICTAVAVVDPTDSAASSDPVAYKTTEAGDTDFWRPMEAAPRLAPMPVADHAWLDEDLKQLGFPDLAADLDVLRSRLSDLPRPEGLLVDEGHPAYELMWSGPPHRFLLLAHGDGRYEWSHWNGDTKKLVNRKNLRVAGRDRGLRKRLERFIA